MIEPKVDEIFILHGIKVKTCSMKDDEHCSDCAFAHLDCNNIVCNPMGREDSTQVIFKEVEQTKIKPMEVKIQIPDNCELIKDGDTYIVKEKKQEPPRSWKEFCERYPVQDGEYFITLNSSIVGKTDCVCDSDRDPIQGKNWCISREEAEAFRALMQLRQLRKAWVGDWEPIKGETYLAIYNDIAEGICDSPFSMSNTALSFPTPKMSEDFLSCFKDLCKTAKILL